MVKSPYLYFLCFDIPASYCLCHLLGSQKMTRSVLIDETFISHNKPLVGFARVLTRSRVIARVKRKDLHDMTQHDMT